MQPRHHTSKPGQRHDVYHTCASSLISGEYKEEEEEQLDEGDSKSLQKTVSVSVVQSLTKESESTPVGWRGDGFIDDGAE